MASVSVSISFSNSRGLTVPRDIDAPEVDTREDEITKTLRDIGVGYTHRNDSLIAENAVEGERIKALLQVRYFISVLPIISLFSSERRRC